MTNADRNRRRDWAWAALLVCAAGMLACAAVGCIVAKAEPVLFKIEVRIEKTDKPEAKP